MRIIVTLLLPRQPSLVFEQLEFESLHHVLHFNPNRSLMPQPSALLDN